MVGGRFDEVGPRLLPPELVRRSRCPPPSGHKLAVVAAGFVTLGCYGLLVKFTQMGFFETAGRLCRIFSLTSVLAGRFIFPGKRSVASTWCGLWPDRDWLRRHSMQPSMKLLNR